MPDLRLSNVTKRYRDDRGQEATALADLNLEAKDGEFLVLVGPSGCGKTTALRLIAGLETLTAGEIHLGERRIDGLEPRERDVALVFQSYALYPHMSVADNMSFGLKIRRTPRSEIDARVAEAAKLLRLDGLLDRLPKHLSGGQRQRVAVGRALLRRPQVFLFDEPLSNLDALLRVELRIELMRLHQELKTTAVYVTHDQVEAMSMGDRIAVFSAGKLQQVATPRELYETPANAFVAGFIGSPPMNLLPAAVLGDAAPAAAKGSDVLVGLRAEDLVLGPTDAEGVAGRVELVEYLGGESIAHVALGDDTRARVRCAQAPARGDAVRLSFADDAPHLFDAATGERLQPS